MAAITPGGPWRSPNDRIETERAVVGPQRGAQVQLVDAVHSKQQPVGAAAGQDCSAKTRTFEALAAQRSGLTSAVRYEPMFCAAATVTRSVMSSRAFMALPPSKSAPLGPAAHVPKMQIGRAVT